MVLSEADVEMVAFLSISFRIKNKNLLVLVFEMKKKSTSSNVVRLH